MSFSRSEIVLLPIPFTDLSSRKVRPAVVLGNSPHRGDIFVAPISSQLSNVAFSLGEWRAAGLNVACGVKPQIATIEDRLVVKTVGRLTPQDEALLDTHLRGWLGFSTR